MIIEYNNVAELKSIFSIFVSSHFQNNERMFILVGRVFTCNRTFYSCFEPQIYFSQSQLLKLYNPVAVVENASYILIDNKRTCSERRKK